MKIALVFDGLQIGGIEKVGSDYAKILLKFGHDVTVFNLCPKYTELEDFFPKECKIEHVSYPRKFAPGQYAKLIRVGSFGKYVYPLISLVLTIWNLLYKFICLVSHSSLRRKYDIAIAFSGHFNDLTFVAKNYLSTNKKLCWTHGAIFQNLLASEGFLPSYLKIKNIIVLNRTAEEEALATNRIINLEEKLNINMLYNPINMDDKTIDECKVRELKERYGDFAIMVARFCYPHKDQYTVVDAMKILNEKYGLKKNIVFVGDGPEKEKVKEYADKLGMAGQCHFVGAHNDVQNYYSAAHLLVHSSIAYEGFVLTLVEAMYYDIPVISTDTIVGPKEVLGNGKYGFLCDVKDSAMMASCMNKLYTDSSTYNHFVEMGRIRKNDFTYDVIGKQLEVILKNLK